MRINHCRWRDGGAVMTTISIIGRLIGGRMDGKLLAIEHALPEIKLPVVSKYGEIEIEIYKHNGITSDGTVEYVWTVRT